MGWANGGAQIESKQESRAVNHFSLYGLAGAGWDFRPVIPAKAGIRTVEAKFATRNQVQTADNGSLPTSRGKARMGERRAQARLCGRDARAPRSSPHKPSLTEG